MPGNYIQKFEDTVVQTPNTSKSSDDISSSSTPAPVTKLEGIAKYAHDPSGEDQLAYVEVYHKFPVLHMKLLIYTN